MSGGQIHPIPALQRMAAIQARFAVRQPSSGFRELLKTATTAESATSGPPPTTATSTRANESVSLGELLSVRSGSSGTRFAGGARLASSAGGPRPLGQLTSPVGVSTYLLSRGVHRRNGRLQNTGVLAPVSGTTTGRGSLLAPAAVAWERMRAAASAEGVGIMATDTYRTWESQARAYSRYLDGSKTAHVLPPGESQHGLGLAVDLTNGTGVLRKTDAQWRWMSQNGPRYGWHPISNEAWHWEFRGVTDPVALRES